MPSLTDVIRRVSQWVLGDKEVSRRVLTPAGAPAVIAPIPAPDGEAQRASGAPLARPGPAESPVRAPAGSADDGRQLLIKAFDAAHPVARRGELRGRDEQLAALSDGVLDQRKHAIVHGARGSGKTSLVHVFADHADRQGLVLIYLSCDAHSDYVSLMRPFLRFVPTSSIPAGRERAFHAHAEALGTSFGPRALVSLLLELAPKPIIFILDEFDRVTDPAVQDAVATTMKLLSDAKAPVQLLVVGIARSVGELIEHHPSLRRHMTAVSVGRIDDGEIARLIEDGAERARMAFDPAARQLLVKASAGSPYHARLFAYHAGLAALADGHRQVDLAAAGAGLRRATREWSSVNEQDHSLFERLAGTDAASRDRIAQLAVLAAHGQDLSLDRLGGDGDPAMRLLAPALDGDGTRPRFRDSLAPQFLLAMLMSEGHGDASRPRTYGADGGRQG